jgi:hypothetical protein
LHSGSKPGRSKLKHLLGAIGIAALPVLAFYIPFSFYIDAETRLYWIARLSEQASEKLSSSILLFQIYQPVYVLTVYMSLFALGLVFFIGLVIKRDQENVQNWVPVDISVRQFIKNVLAALVWFLVVFLLMEVAIYNPGTHIYTYLLPAFVFLGLGIFAIEQLVKRIQWIKGLHQVFLIGLSGLFLFIFLQSYQIFVDGSQEYPWENERFLFWTLKKPPSAITDRYTLSMFGFPYYRDWESIGQYIQENSDFNTVSANEPDEVINFFVRKKGRRFSLYRYYISINNPRSFIPILNERIAVLLNDQEPVFRVVKNNEVLAEIYRLEIR